MSALEGDGRANFASAIVSDLDVLHGICHAFGSTRDMSEALDGTARWIRMAVGSDEASLRIWGVNEAGVPSLVYVGCERDERLAERRELESAVLSKRARLVERDRMSQAVAILPLVSRGEVFGAVEVLGDRRYLERRWQTVLSVASQAAIVFRNLAEREQRGSVAPARRRPVLVPATDDRPEGADVRRRVLVVEYQRMFAESLRSALERSGCDVRAVGTAAEATAAVLAEPPDVALVDTDGADETGIELGRWVLQTCPRTVVIALTASKDRTSLDRAIEAGFSGYITRDASVSKLVASIERAGDGRAVGPRTATRFGRESVRHRDSRMTERLTPRERQILSLLVQGGSSKEIARRLGLSRHTVRTHMQNILAKLGVHSRLEAVTYALLYGLVDPESGSRPADASS